MRPTLVGVIAGWLLSCWFQVPPPVQAGLETAARWIKALVADKLSDYEQRQELRLSPEAAEKPSAKTK